MNRGTVRGTALVLASSVALALACSRDLPTASLRHDAQTTPVEQGPADEQGPVARDQGEPTSPGRRGTSAVTMIVPRALAPVRHLPEMGIFDGGGGYGAAHSNYFRTTETNREFRRGFAEFSIPDFSDGLLAAKLILRETRAGTAFPLPPDLHELSTYTDVDLVVTTSDFDRPTSPFATFETDSNTEPTSFEWDVTSLVSERQGSNLGFRVKLAADPTETLFGFAGTVFDGSATPPGVRLEVRTTLPVAIDLLVGVIHEKSLPVEATSALLAPLERARALLSDESPDNNVAACGQLAAYLRELESQIQAGVLDAYQARDLAQMGLAIRDGLGCPGRRE
jgi:hypothetical protein